MNVYNIPPSSTVHTHMMRSIQIIYKIEPKWINNNCHANTCLFGVFLYQFYELMKNVSEKDEEVIF